MPDATIPTFGSVAGAGALDRLPGGSAARPDDDGLAGNEEPTAPAGVQAAVAVAVAVAFASFFPSLILSVVFRILAGLALLASGPARHSAVQHAPSN